VDAPADSMHDEPKIRHATVEQGNLLHRLGIALDEPWVGISTDGPVSAQHARWRIDTGTEELYDPLPESTREQWDGFGHDAVGLRLTSPPDVLQLWDVRDSDGPVQEWADGLYLRVRYQRIRYQQSVLFAELTYDDQGRADIAIRGAHLEPSRWDREMAWKAVDGFSPVGLLPLPGRPMGPTKGSDAALWLARVDAHGGVEVGDPGERAARAEYYAQTPRGLDRYKWWNDNILRTLRRRKQRQKQWD
jgi:hypothetical protein